MEDAGGGQRDCWEIGDKVIGMVEEVAVWLSILTFSGVLVMGMIPFCFTVSSRMPSAGMFFSGIYWMKFSVLAHTTIGR